MKITIDIEGRSFNIDTGEPIHIAIPVNFDGAQPVAYGVEKASATACAAGKLVGDVRRGGSCNFEEYRIIPHCNGTHTECVGHITGDRIHVHSALTDGFIPATLITVETVNPSATTDSYPVKMAETDELITKKALEKALETMSEGWLEGLVIRTLPNGEDKKTRDYMEKIPPYFSTEAIEMIASLQVRHLLVDMPSIDRSFDDGKLSNHRVFWNVEPESTSVGRNARASHTITEMIFVPGTVGDGRYLLNLQIAPFSADASPSRPVLYRIGDLRQID